MDLNRAITDLYKQRSSSQKQNKSSKPNRPLSRPADKSLDVLEQEPILISGDKHNKKRQYKLDEFLCDPSTLTSFDQLYGIDYVKGLVLSIVDRFKRAIDGTAKKSNWPVLICGSRGLGKTSLVEAAADYANMSLIAIKLDQLIEQTRNEFKESLEHIICHGLNNQPAIVLIDNLEQVVEKEEYRYLIRGAVRRLLVDACNILVFCTTSSTPDSVSDIDFSFTLHLKRPSLEARLKILHCLRQGNENLKDLEDDCLIDIANNAPSFTALDLRKVLDIAETQSTGKPTKDNCHQAIDIVKQTFKRGTHLIGEKPQVTWDNIGGMTEVRQAFAEILRQTRRSGRNSKFSGIALYGPPGCGKTMVAQAMANEAGFNFISIKPAELVDKFLGETEKNIRRVFHEAREHEPCVIYFDEFDGLCGTRGNKDTVTSAIQTLLSEMDGFVSRGQSIILASTNRLEDIDPAMKRPGRLSKHIYVGPPDERQRREIFDVATKRSWLELSNDIILDDWARETDHFTGAEIDFLVAEAESKALSELACDENSIQITDASKDVIRLRREHFEYAIDKIRATNRELDKKTRSIKRTKLQL